MNYFLVKYNPIIPNDFCNALVYAVETRDLNPIKVVAHHLHMNMEFPVIVKKKDHPCEYFRIKEISRDEYISMFDHLLGSMMDDYGQVLMDRAVLSTQPIKDLNLRYCDGMIYIYTPKHPNLQKPVENGEDVGE